MSRALALGLAIAGGGGGVAIASPVPAREVAAIRAVVVRDMTIAVAPWIPCTRGRAVPLSRRTVHVRQALVDSAIARTYAAGEPTHGGIRTRLWSLIAAYGVEGSATRAGETLCDVGGGIDHVRVRSVTVAHDRARMTIQAHEWNETIGRHNGIAFHYKPEAVVAQTDEAVLQRGHWLIARRGTVTFLTGAP